MGRISGRLRRFDRPRTLVRPAVLFEPDRTWWRLWLLIWVGSIAAVALAGFASARLFRAFSESRLAQAPLQPFPLGRSRLLAAAALAAGIALRMASLADPPPQFPDEASLIAPALDLQGSIADFRHPLRAAPYGVPKPFGVRGGSLPRGLQVVALGVGTDAARHPVPVGGRGLHLACDRSPSRARRAPPGRRESRRACPRGPPLAPHHEPVGLGRGRRDPLHRRRDAASSPRADAEKLPRGPGRGRRSRPRSARLPRGLGCSWLLSFSTGLWPLGDGEPLTERAASTSVFGAGFAVAVFPLFALGGPADPPYFARAESHNLLRELRIHRSPMPFLAATADGLKAPWLVPEPKAWADLPSRSRLGWILGIAVAVALARSLVRPRDALSALLLSHAAAGLAAAVAQGESGHPNGYRFVYLTSLSAIATAGGGLALIAAAPPKQWRVAALASVLLLVFAGARGAVDACVLWPAARTSFDCLQGAADPDRGGGSPVATLRHRERRDFDGRGHRGPVDRRAAAIPQACSGSRGLGRRARLPRGGGRRLGPAGRAVRRARPGSLGPRVGDRLGAPEPLDSGG